uniref:Reverse transcriptase domain-containing protein n=1 Tax=Meloidogyne enterolobii TaxID=390850 RepID=A0A6V7URD9_MELEN|nr:unnamed protein product [Meloidogyne enterolobii]
MERSNYCPNSKVINSSLANDYRPISLLSPIGKTMEKIIYNHLVKFIENNNILFDSQHGFSSSKSVTSQLLETLNDITTAIENKEIVDVIYFNCWKAFDSISHQILLDKLTNLGIKGTLHQWIANYLLNRKFKVKIQTSFSTPKSMISGVPQGSILGLCFLFYIFQISLKMFNRRSYGNSVVSQPYFFLPIFYPMFVRNGQFFPFLSSNLPFHILPKNNQKD